MGKYIVEGKVGVLFSPGIGAGFSTWGDSEMCIDGDLVDAFISEDDAEFKHILIPKISFSFFMIIYRKVYLLFFLRFFNN